jgi:hypothetical protein
MENALSAALTSCGIAASRLCLKTSEARPGFPERAQLVWNPFPVAVPRQRRGIVPQAVFDKSPESPKTGRSVASTRLRLNADIVTIRWRKCFGLRTRGEPRKASPGSRFCRGLGWLACGVDRLAGALDGWRAAMNARWAEDRLAGSNDAWRALWTARGRS